MMPAADELDRNYYCCAEVIRTRRLAGQPIPQWMRDHYRRLNNQIHAAASQPSHGNDENADGPTQLDQRDWIIAVEAAAVLGLSKRQVTRIADKLEGQIRGGRWWFRRDAVIQYAEERRKAT
jgi:hypothetical protein